MASDQQSDIRLGASIYLKNVLTNWTQDMKSSGKSNISFSAEEQNMFKENILNAMVHTDREIR